MSESIENINKATNNDSEIEDEDVYLVEKILRHRDINGILEYYIKWQGYTDDHNTWEKEHNIFDEELIDKYWESPVYIKKKPLKKEPTIQSTMIVENFPPESLESWEEEVKEVETITKDKNGNLFMILIWVGNIRTVHLAELVHLKCPQKAIKFYEKHLLSQSAI